MSHKLLNSASFHLFLSLLDQELAAETQQQGCLYCKGKLDQADYPRSPFGIPKIFRSSYEQRISFCCRDCRRRTTPPSVKFFGRRWYPAPFFILISVLTLGVSERRIEQVKRHFGLVVSVSTWKRWRRWWDEWFMMTQFWKHAKGLISTVIDETQLNFPRPLLDTFRGTLEEKLRLLLRFLAPLTGGILRAV